MKYSILPSVSTVFSLDIRHSPMTPVAPRGRINKDSKYQKLQGPKGERWNLSLGFCRGGPGVMVRIMVEVVLRGYDKGNDDG